MQLKEAIAEIRQRVEHPRITNLIHLRFPVRHTLADPARPVARALGVQPISMMGLLVERFGDRWKRLVEAERDGRLGTVGRALADGLVEQIRGTSPVVVCDTEVLYAFPGQGVWVSGSFGSGKSHFLSPMTTGSSEDVYESQRQRGQVTLTSSAL